MAHRFGNRRKHGRDTGRYRYAHQQERARRIATHTPLHMCGYCHQPLGPERLPGDTTSRWHLPHNAAGTAYLPGLWHKACNLREGAIRGNAMQPGRGRRRAVVIAQRRDWYAGR